MKFFLISLVILATLFLLTKMMLSTMNKEEEDVANEQQRFPTRVRICTLLFCISFFETLISLIVWIINM